MLRCARYADVLCAICGHVEQRERLQAAMDNPNSLQLVVDLNWAESLSDKELSSLRKQLCYVYGRVKASLTPPALTLTSYQGRAAEVMQRRAKRARTLMDTGFWYYCNSSRCLFCFILSSCRVQVDRRVAKKRQRSDVRCCGGMYLLL